MDIFKWGSQMGLSHFWKRPQVAICGTSVFVNITDSFIFLLLAESTAGPVKKMVLHDKFTPEVLRVCFYFVAVMLSDTCQCLL